LIRDLERETPDDRMQAEICIVGAGAAGIALAVELARLGRSVVLLEGGGATIEESSQDPYRSEVTGHTHRGVNTGRFRAEGGTTTRWGGQILELDAIDFEKRDWIEGSGWPFAKSELSRHYERALELEGLGGVIRADGYVWKRLGLTEPRFDQVVTYLSRWCPQPNFATLHRAALDGGSIAVWLHANAVGLEMEGDAVRSVRCRTLTGKTAGFTAHRFVFCLGAIESSRFFLQPCEGGLPWNQSGLLGKHFQDHIDSNVAKVVPIRRQTMHDLFDNIFLGGYKYHPKLKISEAAMRELQVLNAGATMYFVSDVDEQLSDLKDAAKRIMRGGLKQIEPRDLWNISKNLPLLARQGVRYKLAHRIYNPNSAAILLRVHCEQEPRSNSSVTLSAERDSLGMLRTRLDWQISELERRTVFEFAKIAKQELAPVADLTIDEDLLHGDSAFLQKCDDSNHHMGGMRMAGSASAGVVDTNLRLFGTQNCYICSAAAFPSSGFSNPTHTLVALAMRLASHLNVQ
jgi:choline dehydrogenase-like flavoprotein